MLLAAVAEDVSLHGHCRGQAHRRAVFSPPALQTRDNHVTSSLAAMYYTCAQSDLGIISVVAHNTLIALSSCMRGGLS